MISLEREPKLGSLLQAQSSGPDPLSLGLSKPARPLGDVVLRYSKVDLSHDLFQLGPSGMGRGRL